MYTVEEYVVDRSNMTDDEYDQFLGGLIDKVKSKVQQVRENKPVRSFLGINNLGDVVDKVTNRPKGGSESTAQQGDDLPPEEVETNDTSQDDPQGMDMKKVLLYGGIGLVGLCLLIGVIVVIRNRQGEVETVLVEPTV